MDVNALNYQRRNILKLLGKINYNRSSYATLIHSEKIHLLPLKCFLVQIKNISALIRFNIRYKSNLIFDFDMQMRK